MNYYIIHFISANSTENKVYTDLQRRIVDQVLQVDSTPVLSQVPETAVTHWNENNLVQNTTCFHSTDHKLKVVDVTKTQERH